MKLADTHQLSLVESLFIESLPLLNEEGEAPRWSFRYDQWKHDPRPNILLLGAYRHPNTGNNLVGGVNLNYLSSRQRDKLARALPTIMAGGNLYSRYHKGRELVPDVFDNFYRTYDSKYVRGVEQGTMFPKYGFLKAAKNYIKKTVGNLFKSKAQREKEAQPQFPSDLSGMKDRLDAIVNQLNQQPRSPAEPETPEIAAARRNFRQFQMDRARRMMNKPEQVQLQQAQQDLQSRQVQRGEVPPAAVSPEAQVQAELPTLPPRPLQQAFNQDRLENQRELAEPENPLEDDPLDLEESIITYYSPVFKRHIIETI